MRRSNQPRWVGLGWDFLVVAACKEGVGKAFAGDQAVSSRNRPPLGTWGRRGQRPCPPAPLPGEGPRGAERGLRGRGGTRLPGMLTGRSRRPQVFLAALLGRATACGRAHPP